MFLSLFILVLLQVLNKNIQNNTIFDFLKENDYTNKGNYKKIRDNVSGRSFKVSYMKRNHKIDDILFDRSPKIQTNL